MPEVGPAGQRRIASARVLCVGAGGLGAPVIQYLAAAGVGRLGIVDDDVVDLTNLQRQVLFATTDIGRRKVEVAAERVASLNAEVATDAIPLRLNAENARDLVRLYDVIVDATDTFSSRYLVNDACRLEGKPNVFGSIFRFEGQIGVFAPDGPCYRCLFPEPPPEGTVPTCAEGGVLGALAGIVGAWQASEALKLVLGVGEPLSGRLLRIDALGGRVREWRIERDVACALCGEAPSIVEVREEARAPRVPSVVPEIEARELDAFLAEHVDAVVLDVREPHEAALGALDGALALPASLLEERLHELDSARLYVVACRVGAKSRWAAERLREAGFARVRHLRDGLFAYAALAESAFAAF